MKPVLSQKLKDYYEIRPTTVIKYIYVELIDQKNLDDLDIEHFSAKAISAIEQVFFLGLFKLPKKDDIYLIGTSDFSEIEIFNLTTNNIINIAFRNNTYILTTYYKNEDTEQHEAKSLLYTLLEHIQTHEKNKLIKDDSNNIIDGDTYKDYDISNPLLLEDVITRSGNYIAPEVTVPPKTPWASRTAPTVPINNNKNIYSYNTKKEACGFKRESKKPSKKQLDNTKRMVILLREQEQRRKEEEKTTTAGAGFKRRGFEDIDDGGSTFWGLS